MSKSNSPKIDDLQKAKQRNPCGLCRAKGLPVCLGHGGAKGSGDENSSHEEGGIIDDHTLQLSIDKLNARKLIQQLIHSEDWKPVEDADLKYEYDNPASYLKITLDMAMGLTSFQGKSDLSKEKQKELEALLLAIKKEFIVFQKELMQKNESVKGMACTLVNNTFTSRMPNPQHYDLFLQQLLNKNLFPFQFDPVRHLKQTGRIKPLILTAMPQYVAPIAPTPFTMQPKPPGWKND